MIYKDIETKPTGGKMGEAGWKAERQMAHYLARAFGEHPEIHIINDLRIERKGEVAQIDHLVIHRFGMVIVESKSSHGVIRVNAHAEFVRINGRHSTGMPSPVEQARRQGELLRSLLNDHKLTLRQKYLVGLMQGGYVHCPIQVLVAISDGGRIEGDRKAVPEVFKADAVTSQIQDIFERHRRAASLLDNVVDIVRGKEPDTKSGQWSMPMSDLNKTIQFLLRCHQPGPGSISKDVNSARVAKSDVRPVQSSSCVPPMVAAPRVESKSKMVRPTKASGTAQRPVYLCTKCQSTELSLRFAKTYFFKCLACDGNTPIRNVCRKCKQLTRTSKRGKKYFSICDTCRIEILFFEVG